MRLNQKIYTVYGLLTIIDKRYSPLSNKVVWIGLDEQGMEHEVDDSMVIPAPQNAPTSDSVDLMAIGKAFNLKKGDKGDRGPMGPKPIAGRDYPIPRNGRDGIDGRNAITVSMSEPINPQEGDIWYQP